jgi:hypothetical protein
MKILKFKGRYDNIVNAMSISANSLDEKDTDILNTDGPICKKAIV